jgi:hypothetical protein
VQLLPTQSETKYLISSETKHLTREHASTLTITEPGILDMSRNYECAASNALGSGRARVQLVAMSRPERPSGLAAALVSFASASVAWEAGFDGGMPQHFALRLNDTSYSVSDSPCREHAARDG